MPLRRLKKASDYYLQHIQLLPVTKLLVQDIKCSAGTDVIHKSERISNTKSDTNSNIQFPESIIGIMRYVNRL